MTLLFSSNDMSIFCRKWECTSINEI